MSLNGRIDRLERELPPGECACGTVHIVYVDPAGGRAPVPPCPRCGLEPLVIRIVMGESPPPWEPGP